MSPAYAVAKETEDGSWVFLTEPFWQQRWSKYVAKAKLWVYPGGAEAAVEAHCTEGAVVVPVVALHPSPDPE